MKEELKDALTLKYQGDIASAKANINVYLNNPVGIGEHPDIISAIDEQLQLAAAADEKLNFLSNEIGW
jgi:hypothetical protein